jgi:hypothetical protein
MKFSILIFRFTLILFAVALVTINASAQQATSSESTSARPKEDDSLGNDIALLKPTDTSSPRATLQSFLDNINRA